jgi:hypothetical protein
LTAAAAPASPRLAGGPGRRSSRGVGPGERRLEAACGDPARVHYQQAEAAGVASLHQHVHQPGELHLHPKFLPHLAHGGLFGGLAVLEEAGGHRPPVLEGVELAPDHQHQAILENRHGGGLVGLRVEHPTAFGTNVAILVIGPADGQRGAAPYAVGGGWFAGHYLACTLTTRRRSLPAGTSTSTSSPTVLPVRALPTGDWIEILPYFVSSSPGPTRV